MKIVAKCLVKDLPYKCNMCRKNPELEKEYKEKKLLPICLKEYAFTNNMEFIIFGIELIGGDAEDFFKGNATLLNENGKDISIFIKEGLKKIESLMDSTDIYEIILPKFGTLCGTNYMEDGTFNGGLIKGMGILPTFLKNIEKKEFV